MSRSGKETWLKWCQDAEIFRIAVRLREMKLTEAQKKKIREATETISLGGMN